MKQFLLEHSRVLHLAVDHLFQNDDSRWIRFEEIKPKVTAVIQKAVRRASNQELVERTCLMYRSINGDNSKASVLAEVLCPLPVPIRDASVVLHDEDLALLISSAQSLRSQK